MRASAGCSFLWELVDELFLLRFLADDPGLPECLGGTVISPWKDALMVREVGHAVKGRHGESASSPLKRGFQGLSIFKSLHNYHYGTFIMTAHSPTPNPESVQKHPQIVADESPSHALGTLRLVWLLRQFFRTNPACNQFVGKASRC